MHNRPNLWKTTQNFGFPAEKLCNLGLGFPIPNIPKSLTTLRLVLRKTVSEHENQTENFGFPAKKLCNLGENLGPDFPIPNIPKSLTTLRLMLRKTVSEHETQTNSIRYKLKFH